MTQPVYLFDRDDSSFRRCYSSEAAAKEDRNGVFLHRRTFTQPVPQEPARVSIPRRDYSPDDKA